jgi:phage-related protein
MAKKINIGAGISLDGEKEFRQAVSGINSDMKVLASEMKKVTAEFSVNNGSIEALSAKDEILNKQLDKQKEKVEALKLALENSQQQYGENDTKTDKWKISLNNAEAEMSKLTKEVNDNRSAMEQAKNPTSNLDNGFKNVGKSAELAGKKALNMGDIIKANVISGAIISGVQSLASKFSSLASNALESADSIQQMADQTGMSAEDIQKWQYAGDTLGVSIDKITGAQSKLTKSMDNVRDGSDKYVKAFNTLGVEVTNSDGSLRDSSTVMTEVFNALDKVKNQTDRNALAMQIFGKGAKDLNPIISAGTGELKKLSEQAKKSGAVMSNDTVSALDDFGDTMDQAKKSVTGMAGSILKELMPTLKPMIKEVQDNAPEIAKTIGSIAKGVGELVGWFVNNAGTILPTIAGIGAGIAAWKVSGVINSVVAALTPFIAGLTGTTVAEEGATVAQDGLNIAMKANPIGLIITAVVGLVTAIVTLWNTNKDFRDAVIKIFTVIKNGFEAFWKGIKGFFTKTIPNAIDDLVKGIKSLPGKIKTHLDGIISKVVLFAASLAIKAAAAAKGMFDAIVNGIKNLPSNIGKIGSKIVHSLWDAITGLSDWVVDKVKGFGGKIVSGVGKGIIGIASIGKNLVQGIWNGISDATSWIIDKIKGFGSAVLNGIKKIFGIHSPSTVFRDEIGKNLALGLGNGFTDTMKQVSSDMSGAIPTDFSINGSYGVSGSVNSPDSNLYNAFAAVANNILLPAMKNAKINLAIETDESGLFKSVRAKSIEYYNRTGNLPFPA